MKPMSSEEIALASGGLDIISFLPPESTRGPLDPPVDVNPVIVDPPNPEYEYAQYP